MKPLRWRRHPLRQYWIDVEGSPGLWSKWWSWGYVRIEISGLGAVLNTRTGGIVIEVP